MNAEYPMQKGARVALYVAGGLCCLLIVAIPLGIWMIVRAAKAKVYLTASGVRATNVFSTTRFDYSEVARFGLCQVALAKNQGLAGGLAQARVGGNVATHLIVQTKADKNRSFMVSSYESSQDIIDEVGRRLGMPCETVTPGAAGGIYSAKWP
jgi:hypothetical protein